MPVFCKLWNCAPCARVTADQAGLQKIAEKFKKYDFAAVLLIGGFEVTTPLSFGTFLGIKLESWDYQMVYISRSCFRSTMLNTGMWRTDRQTRRCRKDRAMHSVAQGTIHWSR